MSSFLGKKLRQYVRPGVCIILLVSAFSCGKNENGTNVELAAISGATGSLIAADPKMGLLGNCSAIDLDVQNAMCRVGNLSLQKSLIATKENLSENTVSLMWAPPQHTIFPLSKLEFFIGYATTDQLGKKNLLNDFLAGKPNLAPLVEWENLDSNEFAISLDSLAPKLAYGLDAFGNQTTVGALPFVFVVGVRDGKSTIFFNLLEYSQSTAKTAASSHSSDPLSASTNSPSNPIVAVATSDTPDESSAKASSLSTFTLKSKTISKVSRTVSKVTVQWPAAGDGKGYSYKVILADQIDTIATLAQIVDYIDTGLWVKDTLQQSVENLMPETNYAFNILARNNSTGEYAVYDAASFSTLAPGQCDLSDEFYHSAKQGCVKKVDPLSVDGLLLDLDASTLSLADKAKVLSWADKSKNKYDFATICTNTPTFSPTGLNGKATVKFDHSLLSNDTIDLRDDLRKKLVSIAVMSSSGTNNPMAWVLKSTVPNASVRYFGSPTFGEIRLLRRYFNRDAQTIADATNGGAPLVSTHSFAVGTAGLGMGYLQWVPSANTCAKDADFSVFSLSELVVIDAAKLEVNDDILLGVEVYLAAKWGVSLVVY